MVTDNFGSLLDLKLGKVLPPNLQEKLFDLVDQQVDQKPKQRKRRERVRKDDLFPLEKVMAQEIAKLRRVL